jgi:hypothetical protein
MLVVAIRASRHCFFPHDKVSQTKCQGGLFSGSNAALLSFPCLEFAWRDSSGCGSLTAQLCPAGFHQANDSKSTLLQGSLVV